jgi:hypothetical protein
VREQDSRRSGCFQRSDSRWRAVRRFALPVLVASFVAATLAAALAGQGGDQTGAASEASDSLAIIPVGRLDFVTPARSDRTTLPEGLSGVAWLGGDRYLAVGDEHASLHPLTVRVDPATGRILKASMDDPVLLADSLGVTIPDATMGKDREGIAIDATGESAWIANECTGTDVHHPSLAKHSLKTGRMLALVRTDGDSMLNIFGRIRYNLGFESLSRLPDGSGYWTANEGPLLVDGSRASDSTGSVVRLQRLDDAMSPLAQYAYPIDSFAKRISSPFFLAGGEVNGVSDLVALPDGRLLALERAFSGDADGSANFRDRIYLVDTKGATDVSRGEPAKGLAGRTYTPARKRLLWELNSGFTNSNFEGMALAGPLENGDRLLLLICDNDQGRSQALYSLRLAGIK